MDVVISGDQYGALEKFVAAISARNRKALSERFLVPEDVIEEIFEAIGDYFDDEVTITAPHRRMTSIPGNSRPPVDAYRTNAGTVIVECVLLADGVPDEAILHVEFVDDSDHLHYRYIGS
ncbi:MULTISPECIES: hypothetical protein [Stenotrophomonas]|uniref:Uncharacterized protein n=1 Tax=Stenotrophomonas maltophilia TaxID=40324 RepID=A0A431UGS6_STEMA|nr:hypothetical protein [Stenotrophomonas maltophilia]RTQ88640.1 hypothetical protein EKL94_12325 [Stenotrophomonas maltophilia]